MVPGHEIVGVVTAVGSEATKFQVGSRIGVGTFVDSCRECDYCLRGEQQYCVESDTPTYNGYERDGATIAFGGYSTQLCGRRRFRGARGGLVGLSRCRTTVVCRHHALLAASPLGRASGSRGRHHRTGRARSHGRQVRRRARGDDDGVFALGRQGDRRATPRRSRLRRDVRPRRVSATARAIRPHHQHSVGRPRPRPLFGVTQSRRERGTGGAARPPLRGKCDDVGEQTSLRSPDRWPEG